MLRTPALIGIAIGALLVTTTPAAATAKPPSGVVDALQRDLGITKDQAINRLANEARGNAAAPGLSKKLGDRFAGIWYEGAESALVVATTSAADTAGITRAGVRARVVPRSLAQLVTLKEGLDRAAPPPPCTAGPSPRRATPSSS